MIYRIKLDREKCSNCGRCEQHWPGIMTRFNCQGYFDLDKGEMGSRNWQFEWAKNLCPGKDGVTEAISREIQNEKETLETNREVQPACQK